MSTIVMYGMGPADDSPRRYPEMTESTRKTIQTAVAGLIAPAPAPKDAIVQHLIARVDWLRTQLAAADGWREELAVLERMLAATKLEPAPEPSEDSA